MTIHIVKLCVGAQSVADQEDWIKRRSRANKEAGLGRVHDHVTRMRPRREEELLNGGSLYWVIKGVILARQEILGLEERIGADEIKRTAILLKPKLILTHPQPRRAFQGWRYLPDEEAPKDLTEGMTGRSSKAPPPELSAELSELGLL